MGSFLERIRKWGSCTWTGKVSFPLEMGSVNLINKQKGEDERVIKNVQGPVSSMSAVPSTYTACQKAHKTVKLSVCTASISQPVTPDSWLSAESEPSCIHPVLGTSKRTGDLCHVWADQRLSGKNRAPFYPGWETYWITCTGCQTLVLGDHLETPFQSNCTFHLSTQKNEFCWHCHAQEICLSPDLTCK